MKFALIFEAVDRASRVVRGIKAGVAAANAAGVKGADQAARAARTSERASRDAAAAAVAGGAKSVKAAKATTAATKAAAAAGAKAGTQAVKTAKATEKANTTAAKAIADGNAKVTRSARDTTRAVQAQASAAVAGAERSVRATERVATATNRLDRAMAGATRATQAAARATAADTRARDASARATDRSVKALDREARAVQRASRVRERYHRILARAAGQQTDRLRAGAGNIGTGARGLGDGAMRAGGLVAGAAVGAGALGASLGFIANQLVGPAAEFERFETVLKTVEGSSQKAKQSMEWISTFAATTPYGMSEVTEAFVAMRAYGLNPANGSLATLGDTAAAMNKPLMQAVEAMADAVTGENERLKEFGIRGAATGKYFTYSFTGADGLPKQIRALQSDRRAIEKAILQILSSRYGGAMAELSKTWDGMVSNLEDQWTRIRVAIMNAGLFDWMKGRLGDILTTINRMAADGSLQRWASDVSTSLQRAMEIAWRFAQGVVVAFQTIAPWASWLADMAGGWENLALIMVAIPFAQIALSMAASFVILAAGVAQATGALFGLVGIMGRAGMFSALGVAVRGLAVPFVFLRSAVTGFVGGFLSETARLVAAAGGWRAALGLIGARLTGLAGGALRLILAPLGLAARAFMAFGAAIMATPAGWILAAVAAIAAAAYLIYANWAAIGPWFARQWDTVRQAFSDAWNWIAAFDWSGLVPSFDWSTVVAVLDWASWVSPLRWLDFIPGFSWSGIMAAIGRFDWSALVPSLDWMLFVPVLSLPAIAAAVGRFDWSAIVPRLDWSALVPPLPGVDWSALAASVEAGVGAAAAVATRIWDGLRAVFEWSPVETIRAAFAGIAEVVDSAVGAAADKAAAAWDAIKGLFTWSGETDPLTIAATDPASIERAQRAVEALTGSLHAAASVDVSGPLGELARVDAAAARSISVLAGIEPAARAAVAGARSVLAGVSFHAEGVAMMTTLADGIRAGAGAAVGAVRGVAQQMRDHLPHSPAKVGPLSDLHRVRFAETLAGAIRPAPAIRAVRALAAGMLAAVPTSLPAAAMAGPVAPVVAPEARSAGLSAAAPTTVTISYSPTVTIAGTGDKARDDFAKQLAEHADQIARLVEEATRRNERREY